MSDFCSLYDRNTHNSRLSISFSKNGCVLLMLTEDLKQLLSIISLIFAQPYLKRSRPHAKIEITLICRKNT